MYEITISTEELYAVLPATILFLTGLALMLIDPFLRRPGDEHTAKSHLTLIGCGGALLSLAALGLGGTGEEVQGLFAGALSGDAFGEFTAGIIILAVFMTSLASGGYLAAQGYNRGEYHALLYLGAGAMVLLAQATNLLSMFVAIETLSLAVYGMAGFFRNRPGGNEGAFKYFVMGAFSSGFLLFGMAFLYGASGSIALEDFAASTVDPVLLRTGILMCIIGFGFKVGAVPFHSWVPDAYQGSPVTAAGWMAVAVKISSFAAFMRLMMAVSRTPDSSELAHMIVAIAVVTMLLGNLAALNQTNVKRMLAYSGIAHSGYLLIPVVLVLEQPRAAVQFGSSALFYFGAYAFMTIGAFAAVAVVSRGQEDREDVNAFNGLARRHPLVALSLTICLVSLAGIPATGGFIGKLNVFAEAVQGGYLYLAIIGVIASLISVYYYIRPIVAMYFREEETPIVRVDVPWGLHFTLFLCILGTFALGLLPGKFMALSQASMASISG